MESSFIRFLRPVSRQTTYAAWARPQTGTPRWNTRSAGRRTSRLRRRASRRKRERGEREPRRHPDPGPASARLRELDAGRAGRGARRGGARHLRARAHAGDVRARRSTAPAAGAVSGLSGPVRHLHRCVLAAVRLDRPGHGRLGPGGRVPTLRVDAPPAVPQDTGARPRSAADCHDRRAPGQGSRLLPIVP